MRIVCIYYFCDRNLVKAEASIGYFIMYYIFSECRGVVPGGTGVDMVPPAFGISVNPGLPYLNQGGGKGGKLCPPNNTGNSGVSDLPSVLECTL